MDDDMTKLKGYRGLYMLEELQTKQIRKCGVEFRLNKTRGIMME
jgi:hypothetical protein